MSDDSVMAMAAPGRPPDPGEGRRKAMIQRLQILLYSIGIIGGLGSGALLVISYISEQRALTTSVAAMRTEVSSIAEDVRAVRGNYPLLEQRVTGLETRQTTAAARETAQDERIGIIDRTLAGTIARLDAWTTPPWSNAPPGRRAP
ncbi:MAG TPA: hypothetical protein VGM87_13915 [Roseomonas sp.]